MTRYMIFSKLVPYGVEGTMMATIDTIQILTTRTIREIMGNGINDAYVHVTNKNQENYYQLKIIGMCFYCLTFLFIEFDLIPTRAEAEELQNEIKSASEVDHASNCSFEDDEQEPLTL